MSNNKSDAIKKIYELDLKITKKEKEIDKIAGDINDIEECKERIMEKFNILESELI